MNQDEKAFAEQLDAEGRELASKYDWNGVNVLRVCQAALTDANFHHEAEIIGQMIAAIESNDQPTFKLEVIGD